MNPEITNLLWNETSFFQSRFEKSASALVAVKQILAAKSLPEDEVKDFLRLYDFVLALSSDIFSQVWSDPTAYFWARNAYDLTKLVTSGAPLSGFLKDYGSSIGRSDPQELLFWHLQDFKKFVLAMHYLAQQDCIFEVPYCPRLPLAIPATSLFLEGQGEVSLKGITHQSLSILVNGVSGHVPLRAGASVGGSSLRVQECPVVRYNQYELPLQVYSFNLPAFPDADPAVRAGIAFQAEQVGRVEESLDLVNRFHPTTFAQLNQFIRLMAFKPRDAGDYGNLTYSDLPGALICSVTHNSYEFAETLIHEFHHNRLFFIEELSPILLASIDESQENRRYYSPWRNDLRPLRGILHAVYVYTPVCQFWLNLHKSSDLADRLRDYAHSQLIVLSLQLKLGVEQLKCHGEFSETGRKIFAQMEAEVESLYATIKTLELPSDTPTMVCDQEGKIVHLRYRETNRPLLAVERVRLHIQDYDLDHQCDQLLPALGLA